MLCHPSLALQLFLLPPLPYPQPRLTLQPACICSPCPLTSPRAATLSLSQYWQTDVGKDHGGGPTHGSSKLYRSAALHKFLVACFILQEARKSALLNH
ncbi:hypothetical protein Pcinc_030568 [Petrolisthes cinctipes]|uniref:Uncharacterized protein n=1 Tax=Petrolisthes cinctipes TaxID=88211 RepID=A0AAE1EYH3_PETCI|nr:hypothetical protein Pcinc_030568 [Petrolisthes cinctipes]